MLLRNVITVFSVCLSPECRSRYSHILNMPPVVLLNKLHIDGVSVKISGTTSDEQNLPKKKKRGRPRKKTRPGNTQKIFLYMQELLYPSCKRLCP